jgi:hypothetical protein
MRIRGGTGIEGVRCTDADVVVAWRASITEASRGAGKGARWVTGEPGRRAGVTEYQWRRAQKPTEINQRRGSDLWNEGDEGRVYEKNGALTGRRGK